MIEFFFAESVNDGFFELNGVDYPVGSYGIKYDGNLADETQAGRNFSLFDINTRRYLIEIKSRHYSAVDGVNSWDELSQLLNSLEVLSSVVSSNIVDADGRIAGIDATTNALLNIDYAHHEIHSGSHFFYDDTHSLAKNTGVDHLVITPDSTKWAHLVYSVGSTGGQTLFEVFEAPTVSDLGVIEPMFNRNRNFPDTPTTLLYESPTYSDSGTRIDRATYGTRDKKSIGGGDRGNSEIVLKQNTMYLFTILELNVAATLVNITFDWYEHTNK